MRLWTEAPPGDGVCEKTPPHLGAPMLLFAVLLETGVFSVVPQLVGGESDGPPAPAVGGGDGVHGVGCGRGAMANALTGSPTSLSVLAWPRRRVVVDFNGGDIVG